MTVFALSENVIERRPSRAWLSLSSLALSASEVVASTSNVAEALARTSELAGLQDRLRELADLPEGWDSYGAPAIDRLVLDAVAHLLQNLPWEEIRPPQVVPTSRGGVALEWHRPGLEFSLEVEPGPESNTVTLAFLADDATGDTWEEDLPIADQTRLSAALRRVATR